MYLVEWIIKYTKRLMALRRSSAYPNGAALDKGEEYGEIK